MFLLVFIVLTLPSTVMAQFNESIFTDNWQVGMSVKSTSIKPGYVIGGWSDFNIFDPAAISDSDACIVKTNTDGFIEWAIQYTGTRKTDMSQFNAIIEVPVMGGDKIPPGYAAFGNSSNSGSLDAYFLRTDLDGKPLFSFVFGKDKNDWGRSLQYINDHATGKYGYVMTGETESYNHFGNTTDIFVVKVDESGKLTKATIIGGNGYDAAYKIRQTSDGGFIVAGVTNSKTCTGTGSFTDNLDILVIKLDANLNIVWNTIVGHEEISQSDYAYDIVQDPVDGSFTVTGSVNSFGQGVFLLNLSPVGSFNWMKKYYAERHVAVRSLHLGFTKCGEPEYVVSGHSFESATEGHAIVFKTDRLGNLQWSKLYGSEGREESWEITDSFDYGYVFTGSKYVNHQNEIYLVEMDENGKSGDCEKDFILKTENQFPCLVSGLQQVFVEDIKSFKTYYKKIEYAVASCGALRSAADEGGSEELQQVLVSPSPADNTVTIGSKSKNISGGQLQVIRRDGTVMLTDKISRETMVLSIKDYPEDLYVIHIVTADGQHIYGRFVKE